MTVSPDLDRRFRDAAVALDLVDLGFDVVDSPVGPLLVGVSGSGLASISYDTLPERRSTASHASPGAASCARRGSSTRPAESSTSTSRAAGAHSTSRSTYAASPRSPSRSSASSRASRTGRRRRTARSRRAQGTQGRHGRSAR